MGVYQKPKSTAKPSANVSLREQMPWLFPLVQLLEDAKQTVHESFDQMKQKLFELVLEASAENLAGVQTPGAQKGPIRWYGSQPGVITLEDRRLRQSKPRLRHKDDGEVVIPAYAILQENGELGAQLLNTVMRGVSTRQYEEVLPAMAEQVGISRSNLSRRVIDASVEALGSTSGPFGLFNCYKKNSLNTFRIDGHQTAPKGLLSSNASKSRSAVEK